MKLTDLEQYESLKNEIEMLEGRIRKYRERENIMVADTVKDYRHGEHILVIRGYDTHINAKIGRVQTLLVERKKRLSDKLEGIEGFIDTLDDSEIRQIIYLKYIEGLSWKAVSNKMYGYPSENRSRMKISRFFAEN